ncbi:electron transfer flavo protein, alpha subunit [Fomitiporia mediterranea MF3/22]|uniref:electron transfer flavo protein, alpha subunit n=1 Tax=Fomitiporia mediterranea (strain MF3/22) TaxID=694068 RepID=UPI0004407A9C|nr:electron transfer flavo protein, alpha subunit [Fomitiporia mediterranea MF3/22]EJD03104.1 electron transfer flavo protein, alpha subunit [Fomitiporia mediterranea MF3/22]
MFRSRVFLKPARTLVFSRTYATANSPHALVFIEHHGGVIESGSLSALSAASQLGGNVTGLIIGAPNEVKQAAEKARKLKGLTKLLHSSSEQYVPALPETVSPLLKQILGKDSPFTHVVSSHSSLARSILPRVAGALDATAVSDVTSVEHNSSDGTTTFTRPIYAGNAIATVKTPAAPLPTFFTVRSTAFDAVPAAEVEVESEEVAPVSVSNPGVEHIRTELTKSDRPELGAASRVVSGGRALKNAETFKATLEPLADVLGAAIGASRAAVDAGYADNSLQVGQTGKVVAPELYMAIGISGAIQHLAGMKDSKMIVAINKDEDAPIFQVADVGLVADLYDAVPELVEKLKE